MEISPIAATDKKSSARLWIIFTFCLFLAFLFLLLATKSSPLYPFNDWDDTNVSFTMGKGFVNRQVLYRDIFDHRGPYLYLVYGLAYLISNTTFLGLFIIEVFSLSIFLFYSFKIMQLFIDRNYAIIALPLLAGSVVNLKGFVHGGSPEEFGIPLLAISLFFLIKYYKQVTPNPAPYHWMLINGFVAGLVFWLKFSLIGFWIGWLGAMLIGILLKKELIRGLKSSLIFLSGIFMATLPWFIYFVLHDSIHILINSYFIINITSYAETLSLLDRVDFVIMNILYHFRFNPISVGLIVIGLFAIIKTEKYIGDLTNRLGFLGCFMILLLSVFGGGRGYLYYFLIFSPFIIFGLLVILVFHIEEFSSFVSRRFVISVCLITIIVLVAYTYNVNQNIYMLQINKDDLVQFKFAEIINQEDDSTLLIYGWLDNGFFTAAGIVPNVRFFYKPNISHEKFPLIMDEQNRYIKEQVVDFIIISPDVVLYEKNLDFDFINETYELISKEKQVNEVEDFYYFLFQKIE